MPFLSPCSLLYLPLVSRGWKNGSNSSYSCTPFLHSLITKGKLLLCSLLWGFRVEGLGVRVYKSEAYGLWPALEWCCSGTGLRTWVSTVMSENLCGTSVCITFSCNPTSYQPAIKVVLKPSWPFEPFSTRHVLGKDEKLFFLEAVDVLLLVAG